MCGPSSAYFYSTRSTAVLNDWRNGWRAAVVAECLPPGGRASRFLAYLATLRHAKWITIANASADEADQSVRGTDWNESWERVLHYDNKQTALIPFDTIARERTR